jgi:hypothetical protein
MHLALPNIQLIIQLPTGIVYYFASSTPTEFSLKKIESASSRF